MVSFMAHASGLRSESIVTNNASIFCNDNDPGSRRDVWNDSAGDHFDHVQIRLKRPSLKVFPIKCGYGSDRIKLDQFSALSEKQTLPALSGQSSLSFH